MSTSRTSSVRRAQDHFEPDADSDPQTQRRLRGQLEAIDYTAYLANREVIGQVVGPVDAQKFQHLGVAAAQARARWVASALRITTEGQPPSIEQVEKLAQMRMVYEELTEVYEAMRRMVERGYLTYTTPPA
jgi:hypothetical protein